MPLTLEHSLNHMAWANQRVLSAIQTLPDDALTAALNDPANDVARLIQHLVEGSEWYAFCSADHPQAPRRRPVTMDDVAHLATEIAELDAIIVAQSGRDDITLHVENEDGPVSAQLLTVLSQAPYHATEHRAQIMSALNVAGYAPLTLDDIDFWAFESVAQTANSAE